MRYEASGTPSSPPSRVPRSTPGPTSLESNLLDALYPERGYRIDHRGPRLFRAPATFAIRRRLTSDLTVSLPKACRTWRHDSWVQGQAPVMSRAQGESESSSFTLLVRSS
jgi:hypothetical protein